MVLQRFAFDTSEILHGERLDRCVAAALAKHLAVAPSRRRIRRLIADGAIYLDGRRTHVQSRMVMPGSRLEVYFDPEGAESRPPSDATLEPRDVLYEDDELLAVAKPAGLVAQAAIDQDRDHVLARARRYLNKGRSTTPELTLPHRLDRGTSGVQLLAKTQRGGAALAEAFRQRRVEKEYLALALRDAPPAGEHWRLDQRLDTERDTRGRRTVAVTEGGKEAETEVWVVETLGEAVLLRAKPRTGRMHQVRVHLADAGLPILGDRLYGAGRRAPAAARPMLHAAALSLTHPASGHPVRIACPPPPDFLACLEALRQAGSQESDTKTRRKVAAPGLEGSPT